MMGKCCFPLFLASVHTTLDSFVETNTSHQKLTLYHKNSNFRYLQWQLTSTISTIATTLNLSSTTDLTPILHRKLATSICTTATKFCNGTNLQYQNQTACENHLVNQTRFGEGWEWGMDTVSCRMVCISFRYMVVALVLRKGLRMLMHHKTHRSIKTWFPCDQKSIVHISVPRVEVCVLMTARTSEIWRKTTLSILLFWLLGLRVVCFLEKADSGYSVQISFLRDMGVNEMEKSHGQEGDGSRVTTSKQCRSLHLIVSTLVILPTHTY
jgi:hypothetical protein